MVHLDVGQQALYPRIKGRQVDPVTGKLYHPQKNPAPVEVKKRLETRTEDSEDGFAARLRDYSSGGALVLEAFRGLVHDVDGAVSAALVTEEICRLLARQSGT